MKYEIITPDKYKTVPWKNGLGKTTELAIGRISGLGKYAWRLSIAGIVNDGPFSDFTGYDRSLVLLEGNGVVLTYSDGKSDSLKNRFDIALFSGDLKTNAKLVDGPVRDFNVMTLRGICRAEIHVMTNTGECEISSISGTILIYPADDDISISWGLHGQILLPGKHLFMTDARQDDILTIKGRSVICVTLS